MTERIKKLNSKHKKFAQEFLKDFNATRAYKVVYKSKNQQTAASNASKLLRNAKVQNYLSVTLHQTKLADIMDIDAIIRRLSEIASGKPLKSVFKRTKKNKKTGKMEVEYDTVTIATPDVPEQLKAIEMLGRYYKIFLDVNKDLESAKVRKANAEAKIVESQLKAIEDAGAPDNRTVVVDDIEELKANDANS